MEKLVPKKFRIPLLIILLVGLSIRFINFNESLYFGYDEARDAYISQDIYLEGDLKILGPQASSFAGIHHGPLYYYLIGPLFILGGGDPYFVSVIFRIINAAGIVGVFAIGNLLLTPAVGLISAFIYAVSYEQFIYAIFTGNPALANVSWILMFLGAGIVYKMKNKKAVGLMLMFLGASLIPQFDMIIGYSLLVLLALLLLMRSKVKNLSIKKWVIISFIGFSPLYSYVIAEFKNNFIALKTASRLIANDVSIVREGESEFSIFLNNFIGLFRNNILDLSLNKMLIGILLGSVILYLISTYKKNRPRLFIAIWILSFSVLILARGFMPLYSYAGAGIGLIIGAGIVLEKIGKRSKLLLLGLLALIAFSNLTKTVDQSTQSLVVEIKAQPGMKLSDEIKLVNKTYEYSDKKAFTIRTTSMPYKIQTVWAYLYEEYGEEKYGYLPYFETGNVAGFPGSLPVPQQGTTCNRFLIVEPTRGIPQNLLDKDVNEENLFSEVVKEEKIGKFVLQHRMAKDKNCHDTKPLPSG